MRVKRCDNCGRENVETYRFAHEAREAAYEANAGWVHVDHDNDVEHADACSWACLAEIAMSRHLAQSGGGTVENAIT